MGGDTFPDNTFPDNSSVDLGSILARFGIDLGSIGGRFGIVLGSIWGRFGVHSRSVWDRFGIILGSIWVGSAWIWGRFVNMLGTFADFVFRKDIVRKGRPTFPDNTFPDEISANTRTFPKC